MSVLGTIEEEFVISTCIRPKGIRTTLSLRAPLALDCEGYHEKVIQDEVRKGGHGLPVMAQSEAYKGNDVDNREIEMPCHLGLERSPLSGVYLEVVPVREFHSGLFGHKGEKKASYYRPVVVDERKDSARLPIHVR